MSHRMVTHVSTVSVACPLATRGTPVYLTADVYMHVFHTEHLVDTQHWIFSFWNSTLSPRPIVLFSTANSLYLSIVASSSHSVGSGRCFVKLLFLETFVCATF